MTADKERSINNFISSQGSIFQKYMPNVHKQVLRNGISE